MKEKRFVKIYTAVIWTVTLLVILLAIGRHMGGIFDFGSKKSVSNTIAVNGNVEKIKIDVDAGNVTIQQGDKFEVSYKYPEKYAPTVQVSKNDGTLEIKQKQNKATSSNNGDLYKMTITIPENSKFTTADMSLDYGRLAISDLDCAEVSANCDCGDFEYENCTTTDLSVNVDMGEIHIKDSTVGTISANADMGDITMDVDTNSVTAHCDMGNVSIQTAKSEDQVSIKASCGLGKVTVNGKDW